MPAASKTIGCGKFFTELKLATPSLPLHQNAADPLFLFGIDKTSLGVGGLLYGLGELELRDPNCRGLLP